MSRDMTPINCFPEDFRSSVGSYQELSPHVAALGVNVLTATLSDHNTQNVYNTHDHSATARKYPGFGEMTSPPLDD